MFLLNKGKSLKDFALAKRTALELDGVISRFSVFKKKELLEQLINNDDNLKKHISLMRVQMTPQKIIDAYIDAALVAELEVKPRHERRKKHEALRDNLYCRPQRYR